MVNIQLLCVGKLKEKHFAAACAEYVKRLGAFCKLTVTELPEDRLPDNPSQAQIDAALEKEAAAILAKIPKGSKIVALCVEGKSLTSEQLAQVLSQAEQGGHPGAAFVIGSSYGLSDRVKAAAHCKLSLSALTLPHKLARLVLAEAVYRAGEIRKGSRYHK